jgi:hypothetical protein
VAADQVILTDGPRIGDSWYRLIKAEAASESTCLGKTCLFHISPLFEKKTVRFARCALSPATSKQSACSSLNQCVHVTTLRTELLFRITPAAEPQMRLLTNYHVWKHLFRHERRRTHRNTVCLVCQGEQNSFVITLCLNSWRNPSLLLPLEQLLRSCAFYKKCVKINGLWGGSICKAACLTLHFE